MPGAHGQENKGGLIPTAMLSTMFGRMMPDALQKLKEEAPKTSHGGDKPQLRSSIAPLEMRQAVGGC
jgi:hypothetical protein